MPESFEFERTNRPVTPDVRAAILANPGFGRYFTDHMASVKWTSDNGWHDAKVVPYAPIAIDPATNFVHLGRRFLRGSRRIGTPMDRSRRSGRPQRSALPLLGQAPRNAGDARRVVPRVD